MEGLITGIVLLGVLVLIGLALSLHIVHQYERASSSDSVG